MERKPNQFGWFNNEAGTYTIVYDHNGDNETIVGVERRKKSAVEACKRLNSILKIARKQSLPPPAEAKEKCYCNTAIQAAKCGRKCRFA